MKNKQNLLYNITGAALCNIGFIATLLCQSQAATAGNWSLGAGAFIEQTPYRNYDKQIYPMPIVSYDGDYLFFNGNQAGIYAIKNPNNRLYAHVAYHPTHFKTSQTDNSALKQLDNRKSSLMAGAGYSHQATWGNVRTHVMADVNDNSHGVIADLAYGYPVQVGNLHIEPSIGVQWQSRQYNNYYYGISNEESQRSGLIQYNAESGSTPYLALNAHYMFNKKWQAFIMGRYTRLSNAIKDSPMTERSSVGAVGLGIVYHFGEK